MNDVSNLTGAKLGNYRLERLIGRGRMGVVYLAHDEALLRPTALKILSWQAKDQDGQNPEAWFIAEARSVARVNHPNVVQIYGVARQGPHCYIAMEYVRGGPVDALINKDGPFPAVRATEILLQTAGALQAAHDAGIVHRDVKPENLLMGADGGAKLGDFGMALHLSKPRRTEPARAGTPFYTAPEIWSGQAATPRTDLYALGATYYYLLTGRVPFEAIDLPSLISAHLTTAIPLASNLDAKIPSGCDRIIQRCLAKSPKDRFLDARSLGSEAEILLNSLALDSPTRKRISSRPLRIEDVPSESPPAELRPRKQISASAKATAKAVPAKATYVDEPLLGLSVSLTRWLDTDLARAMVLLGENGSGRTTLARQLMKHHEGAGPILYFDGKSMEAIGSSGDPIEYPFSRRRAEIMMDWVKQLATTSDTQTFLVLDANTREFDWLAELATLVCKAPQTESLKLLVIDTPDHRELWLNMLNAFNGAVILISEVPKLTLSQSLNFVHRVVSATQEVFAGGPLATPDACLLLAHRGNGNIGRISDLLQRVLNQACAEHTRVITSWDAWDVKLDGKGNGDSPIGTTDQITRPVAWPTGAVLEILNQCRKQCGIRPRR